MTFRFYSNSVIDHAPSGFSVITIYKGMFYLAGCISKKWSGLDISDEGRIQEEPKPSPFTLIFTVGTLAIQAKESYILEIDKGIVKLVGHISDRTGFDLAGWSRKIKSE